MELLCHNSSVQRIVSPEFLAEGFYYDTYIALACGGRQKPAIPRLGTAYSTILACSMQTTAAMTAFIVSGLPRRMERVGNTGQDVVSHIYAKESVPAQG